MDETYRGLFTLIITLVTGLIGVPIIQWIKNSLGWEDKKALVLAAAVSVVLAFAELLLTNQIDLTELTIENLPKLFASIFTVATIYYGLFKGTSGLLGKGFMIRETADNSTPVG